MTSEAQQRPLSLSGTSPGAEDIVGAGGMEFGGKRATCLGRGRLLGSQGMMGLEEREISKYLEKVLWGAKLAELNFRILRVFMFVLALSFQYICA